jgi:hypothetical protein
MYERIMLEILVAADGWIAKKEVWSRLKKKLHPVKAGNIAGAVQITDKLLSALVAKKMAEKGADVGPETFRITQAGRNAL